MKGTSVMALVNNSNIREIDPGTAAYISIEVIIAFLTVISNSMVIAAIYKFKNMQTPTFWLVGNLAVADIGIASIAIPSGIVLRIGLQMKSLGAGDSEVVNEYVCLLICSSVITLTQVSIFSLLLIAFDRFIAFYYSLRYKALVTPCRTKIGIGLTWLLSIVIGLIPLVGWNSVAAKRYDKGLRQCSFEEMMSMQYMVCFNFLVCVLLPFAIMLVLYRFVYKSAKEQLKKIYSDVSRRKSSISLANIKEFFLSLSSDNSRLTRKCVSLPDLSTIKSKEWNVDILVDMRKSGINGGAKQLCATVNANKNTNKKIPSLLPKENLIQSSKAKRVVSYPEYSCSVNALDDENFNQLPMRVPSCDYSRSISVVEQSSTLDRSSDISPKNVASADATKEILLKEKQKRRARYLKLELRAATSFLLVIGVFAVCWLPLHIHNTITYIDPDTYRPPWLTDILILLTHANSMVNPIIYGCQIHDMKVAFKKMIQEMKQALTSLCERHKPTSSVDKDCERGK